jgi:1,4-alpha-glucan branching enzyme
MIEDSLFGPLVTPSSVTFRLWAPGAQRVDLLTEQTHRMCRTCTDGWYAVEVHDARAGARYRFRVDEKLDVPDDACRAW